MDTKLPSFYEVIPEKDLQDVTSFNAMPGIHFSTPQVSPEMATQNQAIFPSLSFFPTPDPHPVTSGNLEPRPLFRTSPFHQVAQGDPLIRLKPDQIWSSWSPQMTNKPNGHASGPTPLGALDLESLNPNQVVFIFGILCIMARLNPRFEFKYGGSDGKEIGLRLTFFGHTIVLDPMFNSVKESKEAACKKALWKLRKFNPHWLCPPFPNEGPTGPEWDWTKLVEAFCNIGGISPPLYNPICWDGKKWHCDLTLKGGFFRTGSACDTSKQAENTVAHIALYDALINELNLADHVLPATEAPIVIKRERDGQKPKPKPNAIFERLNGSVANHSGLPPRIVNDVLETFKVAHDKRMRRGRQDLRYMSSQSPNPSAFAKLPRPTKPQKVKKPKLGNANRVPLFNSRVAPLEERPETPVDLLATLKAFQKELDESKDLSFHSILIRMCAILRVNMPEIRHEDDPEDPRPLGWCVHASFDQSHPYLNRASPITLLKLPKTDEKVAVSIGVRKLILYLLNMAKEDAGLTSEEWAYGCDLHLLKDLEKEIQDRNKADGNLFEAATSELPLPPLISGYLPLR